MELTEEGYNYLPERIIWGSVDSEKKFSFNIRIERARNDHVTSFFHTGSQKDWTTVAENCACDHLLIP